MRVRSAFSDKSSRLRISVFRSLKHIYAQIIDDQQQTLASSSSEAIVKDNTTKLDKKALAKEVGKNLAKKAIDANILDVYFDRGPYLYHGRVRSLAEGLREGGLKL